MLSTSLHISLIFETHRSLRYSEPFLRLSFHFQSSYSVLWVPYSDTIMGALSSKMGVITSLFYQKENKICLCIWPQYFNVSVCRLICTKRHNCRCCPVRISLLFETHRSLRDFKPFFWFYRSHSIIPPSIPCSLFWPLMGALSPKMGVGTLLFYQKKLGPGGQTQSLH